MKKRFLCTILVFLALVMMPSIVFAENGGGNNSKPDFTVQAVHQEYKESIKDYPMVLTFTNNTDQSVTVTGDENHQFKLGVQSHPMFPKEFFNIKLYGGVEFIEVEAHTTKEIGIVPNGGTDCWNAFYHPMLLTGMDVSIKVNDELKNFENINYAITGVISNPLYVGKIVSTDNEDGTATLRFKLEAYQEEHEITCDENECMFNSLEPVATGLKTGLKKADFSIQRGGELLGEIIQAKEVSPAEYELVWKYTAGKHEYVVLNTASGYGDFFVTSVSKDESGKLKLDSRDERFSATITHKKDSIIINHEEATLETAGATNIPKLVNLYFKVVDDEFDEKTMKEIEENVQKTSKNKEIVHIYDISLLLDGVEIQPNGNVKITIPLNDKMKTYTDLKVVYISETGEVTEVESEVTENGISFITNHFSYYAVIGSDIPKSPQTGEGSINYALFIGSVALVGAAIMLKNENIRKKYKKIFI